MHNMHTVLIVDDEIRLRSSLEVLLKAEGYQVHVAGSGAAAFSLLQQHGFSAALVDINLPDVSGNVIAARINEEHPGTAIIILTGRFVMATSVLPTRSSGS